VGPLAGAAGRRLEVFASDPVAIASWAAETGFVDPVDAARLAHAGAADPLAQRALARHAHRAGDLAGAEAIYAELVEAAPEDVLALSDAARVELELGDTESAVELYRRAIEQRPSAELWFDLSQAHARAIDIEAHEAALAAAQELDPETTRELTQQLAVGGPTERVALPLSAGALRERVLARSNSAAGDALRARIAAGALGRTPWLLAIALAVALAAGIALSHAFEPSRACVECGTRLCPRCETGEPASVLCARCSRRRVEARHGGPWDAGRAEAEGGSPAAVRLRRVARGVVPGLFDVEPARPAAALATLLAAAGAVSFWLARAGAVPDPASAGAAGTLLFGAVALALAAACLVLGALARRTDRS
jgi:hypothetical protein